MMRILLLCSFVVLCRAQDPVGFTIAGHVVRHLDQKPMSGVRVSITMVKEQGREVSVTAGVAGEFAFRGVPAGKYQLRVFEHATPQLYQQSDGFSTAVVAGPNLDTGHIVFPLESLATISGTVVDEYNEPAPRMQVYLFRQALMMGKHRTEQRGSAVTSTSGAFHFRGLEPGTYYLATAGRPWYAQEINKQVEHSELDVAYPVTYYSGAASPEGATPLMLEEGQKAQAQINVRAVPGLHIKMEGLASEGPRRPPRAGISVTQAGPGGSQIHLPVMQTNDEVVGIAPGNYSVTLQQFGPGGPGSAVTQTVSLTADTTLQMTSGPKTVVKGRVILDGVDVSAKPGVSLLEEGMRSHYQRLEPDGTFEMQGITPGHYALGLGEAGDSYVAKVEVRGGTYANGELNVALGAHVELLITPGHGLAKVEGTVVQDTKPVAGAMVILLPQDGKQVGRIPRDQSDSDGTFTMAAVKPGRYTLLAIDNGRGLAYGEPAAIAPYLPHGLVVDVPLQQEVKVEVQRRLQ